MDQSVIFDRPGENLRSRTVYVLVEFATAPIIPFSNSSNYPEIAVVGVFTHRRDATNFITNRSIGRNIYIYETQLDPHHALFGTRDYVPNYVN